MEKKLIFSGLLAGAVGGLTAWIFALLFAEPLIDRAIAYEDGRAAAQEALDRAAGFAIPAEEGGDVVSRGIQSTLGLGVGLFAFGLAMGALFAVTYAVCLGRTGQIRARPLALLVAAAGFVTVSLIPFIKYPANPPAASNDETVGDRASLFLLTLVIGVLVAVIATAVGQQLKLRLGTWNAALIAGAGFVAVIAIALLILPPLGHLDANVAATGAEHNTETPRALRDPDGTIVFPGFPADVLAEFRVYSVAAQALLWAVIGLVFAPLADRLLRSGQRPGVAPPQRETVGI
ncbi:CbtA family protein [Sporichthya sp.]|uniref:CbtA family protein n=1 Tax=Sporichthya sp. TaxID=65475 RepID=UPI001842E3D9|nr:CbtA family protein [Sporichthya sp.]MBA3744126.1 CbtA family protein [Sporichthya sp.]